MKKYIFLILILIFVSGCTANYELEIKSNKIKEKLTILETNIELFDKENDSGWTLRDSFEALLSKDEFSKNDYSIKSLNNKEQLGVEYYNKKLESMINSTILNQCYSNPSVIIDKNIVKIKTGDSFECYELYENLESVKVTFKTNHKVIYTNSDLKQGNSYIWNITEKGNKNIEISYDNSKTNFDFVLYLGIFIVFIVLIIIATVIIKKLKNRNEF